MRCCPSLPKDLVRVPVPDPVPMADMHLQLQDPQHVPRLYPRKGNIFLAISFPNLLKLLPPTSSGSVRADTITNFAVLGSDPNHSICRNLDHLVSSRSGDFPMCTTLPGPAEFPDFRKLLK